MQISACSMPPAAALALATSLLAGCTTVPFDVNGCPPVAVYPEVFLGTVAAELEHLPRPSAIEEMLADYSVMRDQARACADMADAR